MSDFRWLRDQAVKAVRERASTALGDLRRAASGQAARLWARRPTGARAAAVAFCALLAAAGAASILAQARLPRRLPTALDWAAARALLERDARPGDAVLLSPPWAERAREALPAAVPVLAQARLGGEGLPGVRRVWLLELPRAPWASWDAELDLVARGSRAEPGAALGGLALTRHDLSFPSLPLSFLPDRLREAEVTLGGVPCLPDGPARLRCGDGAAQVERTVRDLGGAPRPCLELRGAAPASAPLALTFPATRLGRTLAGHAASAGGPARASLLVDGEAAGEVDLGGAWAPFRLDLTRRAGAARALTLILASPTPLAACLDAAVLP